MKRRGIVAVIYFWEIILGCVELGAYDYRILLSLISVVLSMVAIAVLSIAIYSAATDDGSTGNY